MCDKFILKTKYFACVGLILVVCYLLSSYFMVKDFSIKPSTIPENELWTIRQAQSIEGKVTPYGHHQIEDSAALLALIRQAYQWDKNAMMGYADYLDFVECLDNWDDAGDNFDDFLNKHEEQIVDKNGTRLERPDIFDNTRLLYEKLAKSGYPWAALKQAISIYHQSDINTFIAISQEERTKKISYLYSAITGGYHSAHVLLADTILFSVGEDCSGPECNKLNMLNNFRVGLSLTEIRQALDEYKIVALHGSSYGMFRLAEAYHNGIGVKKNNEEAYLWGQMAIFAFHEYQKRKSNNFLKNKSYIEHREQVINSATEELLQKIDQELTESQKLELNSVMNKRLVEIITWDYYQWEDDIDPVPPKP